MKVTLDARFYLLHTPLELALREVPIARVDALELAAVDGGNRMGEEAELATDHDEARADSAECSAVRFLKIGDGLEVLH